MLNAGLNIDL